MTSLRRAEELFTTKKFSSSEYVIGHLSDETAKLYARDMFLIGYDKESEILSGNDTSRYTAIVNKISGQACEVFFDLADNPPVEMKAYDGRGSEPTEVSH